LILEEETYKRFGYYPSDLSRGARKKILAACDDCGKIRVLERHNYRALCHYCAMRSEEARAKRSAALKGNKNCYGNHPSEESRRKMSIAGKGRHPTDEARAKISAANKGERNHNFGKHPSKETREKMSATRSGAKNPNYGKHHSEETRKKISIAQKGKNHYNFGKHLTEETKRKITEANKGKNHYNWKNGASFEPYCHKFNNEFKQYIRAKFGNVCFLCGKTEESNGRKLSVHHVNYDKHCGCAETEEDTKADDETCQFVPLCISCNSKVNGNRDKWEKYFKNKLRNKLNGWYI
jgi:hypothetical protein